MNHVQKISYQGFVNQGSTCYLNSLLQTLFMTPQFRKNIYSYKHSSKKIDQKNSIPYQLQKLFVLLQTSNKPVITKGLLKSFQWNQADAFQQHDVQQFCRVLFQAIQISNKKAHWVSDLFSGSMISYIDCSKHLSQKQQIFMDISLPIHNPYTKKQFQSLQECVKQYLRPQKLQDKISCEQCNDKVFVQKGLRIRNLPPILTIQLNRFQLNYQTWTRQKVNTFLYFPQILYMNKFMKKYEQIQISPLPEGLKSKVKINQKQKSARTMDYFGDQNNKNSNNLVKINVKRKKSDQIQSQKQKVFFFDEQNKRKKQQKNLSKEQQKQRNKQILANLKSQKNQIEDKMKKKQQKQKQKQKQKQINQIEDDMLFGNGMGFLTSNEPLNWNSGAGNSSSKPNFSKIQTIFQHEQEYFDPKKQYPQNSYMLYAVLVHSGGAYGGHYFAFIFNGKDWYRFDDSTVKKSSRFQMRKYGGFDKTSHGANAYLLFYRDVNTFNNFNPDQVQIPVQLLEKVKFDVQNNKQEQSKIQKRFIQLNVGVMIKVTTINKINQISQSTISNIPQSEIYESILVENRHEETISNLKLRIKSLYPELEILGDQNWRIRRFNKVQQTLHQVYDQSFDQVCFETLGFRQTVYLAIQTKNKQQIFQNYDPKQIVIKVNNWRPDIVMVTQKMLKPVKIQINQQASFNDLRQKIEKRFKISSAVIMKRNFSQSNPITIFPQTQQKKLIQLRFFNGINLYVQQPFIQGKSRWVDEFQSERFRCMIKYNDPNLSQNRDLQLYFDTRKTLKQLKQKLSQLIKIDINNFRIKKTKQSVSQLTTYNKKLYDLKFINNQFIYLQKGKSSYGSLILKKGKAQIIDDKIQFNIYQEAIIQIQQNIITVNDILLKLSQRFNIKKQKLRIRQFKAYQFGQIFKPNQLIQRIKQKSLIWQQLPEESLSQIKGIQLYIRIFNIMTLQLSQLKQIYIQQDSTYQQLGYIIEEQTGITYNKVLVWKALSNYVEKSILIDCEWLEVSYIRAKIKQEPLYIGTDGEILIIKQADKEYHPKINPKIISNNSSVYGPIKEKEKQTQLKITVLADHQDQGELLQTNNIVNNNQIQNKQ